MSTQTKRMTLIDSLRGFALLGILLVNIGFFTTSLQTISLGVELWTGLHNDVVTLLKNVFVDGKFIIIFSFLFGLGMVLLQESSMARGKRFVPIYLRRLIALLIFGLIHGIFIWFGDILTHYAILGFFLLLFHRCKPKTLLTWSIVLLLLVPILFSGISMFGSGESGSYSPPSGEELTQLGQFFQERDARIYAEGTMTEITLQRINDLISSVFNMLVFYPQILGMFLMGAYFGKRKLFQNAKSKRPLFTIIALVGGAVGLALQILLAVLSEKSAWFEAVSLFVGAPLLSLAYISIFTKLYQKESWERGLHLFSYTGKMAFTNYICQSVICGFIFYGYGLGLYGKVEPFWLMLMVLGIFVLQTLCSKVWLKRFAMGPLEYVWRAFTYWGSPVKTGSIPRD